MTTTDVVQRAKVTATAAHRGQTRWDEKTPYIAHPAEVVRLLYIRNKKKEFARPEHMPAMKAVGWLHDVVEDTETTLDDLKVMGFSQEICEAIDAITKREGEEYVDYLIRVNKNAIARQVKIADLLHNLSDLKKGQRRQKYELALYNLSGERICLNSK